MRALLLALLLAAVAAVGCSGNDTEPGGSGGSVAPGGSGGGGGSGPAIDAEAFCGARRDAVCDVMATCYPGVLKGDKEACKRNVQVNNAYSACLAEVSATSARIGLGIAGYDADAAAACMSDFAAAGCPGDLFPYLLQNFGIGFPCPLSDFAAGNLQTGKRCQTSGDCAEGNFCGMRLGDCYGTCQSFAKPGGACSTAGATGCGDARCQPGYSCAAPVKTGGCGSCQPAGGDSSAPGDGEACVLQWTDWFCQKEFTCRAYGDANICVKRGAVDEPCQETWECEFGLVCGKYDGGTKLGTCMKQLDAGAECSVTFPDTVIFPTDPCEPGSRCADDGTGAFKCQELPGMGEACVAPAPGADPVPCAEGVCIPSAPKGVGTCGAPLGDRTGCPGLALQEACAAGLRCRQPGGEGTVTCLAPSADGEPCEVNMDCASGRCVSGAPGEPYKCLPADFICE